MNQIKNKILTISQLTSLVAKLIEEYIPNIKIEGEVFEIKTSSNGHIYMTLKDASSQISTIIWKSTKNKLKFLPKVGDLVIASGTLRIYKPKGALNFIISSIELSGDGDLRLKLLALKDKLEKKGYFATEIKKTIPKMPKAIGIITSKEGAALYDILSRIESRLPIIPIYLIDVRVQGDGSASDIVQAIEKFNKLTVVDVIILTRGGGSLEDLWSFNEEKVVKAIYNSNIPIVTAIGHQVDNTLSDLVADLSVTTPTAAAESIVPDKKTILREIALIRDRFKNLEKWFYPKWQNIDEITKELKDKYIYIITNAKIQLHHIALELQKNSPIEIISKKRNNLSRTTALLNDLLVSKVLTAKNNLASYEKKYIKTSTKFKIQDFYSTLEHLSTKLTTRTNYKINYYFELIKNKESTLKNLNPLSVLNRGYALVKKDNKYLTSKRLINIGDNITIQLKDGYIDSTVIKKRAK